MDLFEKNIKAIRKIATNLYVLSDRRYEIDELINEAWIKFHNTVKGNDKLLKNPKLIHKRVHFDMVDYMREKDGARLSKKPSSFISPINEDGENILEDITGDIDNNFTSFENRDLLIALNRRVKLTKREWTIIRSYFYGEKTLKEAGQEIGTTETWACRCQKTAIKKYKDCAKKFNFQN